MEAQVNEELVEKEAPEEKKEEVEHVPPKCADNPFPDSLDTYPTLPKAHEYKPKISYPQRLQKETKDKQFLKFLEVFRKLQINIPFAEGYLKLKVDLGRDLLDWSELMCPT
ncbi:hypothetical protein AHAS_Ahas09G0132800 [Arachis hypogaea]